MINGLVMGTLFGDAEMRDGKNATRFAVAKVKAACADAETVLVNVIAFDADTCNALMAAQDGDTLALSGSLTPKVWSDKQGNTRPSLDMVASKVLTAYPDPTARL
jgi:single-stranded DNA-binding protein